MSGSSDPGALNCAFDVYVYPFHEPQGGSTLFLEGVSPTLLRNAQTFANQIVELRAGMGPGLPLAKPAQAGMIFRGEIQQAFGNVEGTEIVLALYFNASSYTLANPGNIVLNWTARMPLATALTNTLKIAYPQATISMNISNIVLSHDEVGFFSTLEELAMTINHITSTDVAIVPMNGTIYVTDSTYQPTPKLLDFLDFVGQPTWVRPQEIQSKLVLRGDLSVNDIVKFPTALGAAQNGSPNFVTTQLSSLPSQANYQSLIKGNFKIASVRHVGNLRVPDGNQWCTIVQAVPAGS